MTVYNLLIEAVFVGFFSIIIGFIIGFIVEKILKKPFKNSNIYYTGIVCLFLVGFFTHLSFQFIGINKRYCKVKDTFDTSIIHPASFQFIGIDKRYCKAKTNTFDTSIIHPASL